jgi:hypothetical protein
VGLLYVRTRESDTALGEDFGVLRVKRRFWTQSYAAAIYTGRHTRGPGTSPLNTAGLDFRLATSRFRERKNLEFDGFMLWTTDRTGIGENLAYGSRIGYPNEPWSASLSYEVVEKHHDPGVGFVPRTGFKNLNPRIEFQPRPPNHPWIRRFNFSFDANLLVDPENRWLTRDINLQVLRVETHRQDGFDFSVSPQYERLEEDFEISDGVVLPAAAEYTFNRYRLGMNTANRRVVSVRADYEWGGFFSGSRREFSMNMGVRPRPGIRVQLESEWNEIALAEGSFATQTHRLVTDTQFNPWMFVVSTVQFDTVSRVVGWQGRFRWTLRPGNDLFVVYTHNWLDDRTLDRFATLDRRAAAKFVYTYRF